MSNLILNIRLGRYRLQVVQWCDWWCEITLNKTSPIRMWKEARHE